MNRFTGMTLVALGWLAAVQGCAGDASSSEVDTDTSEQVEPASSLLYQRGLVYRVDGKDYFLHGPMESGARDIPGHDWMKVSGTEVSGRLFNTGPFGMPKWWSSNANDGQLLYLVDGIIDTWSPEQRLLYNSLGYVHYHKLVSVEDRQPHPTKVMWLQYTAVGSFTLDGGPRPWLAHEVIPGIDFKFQPNTQFPYPPREKLLYVGCVDVGGQDPDFMLVIGADPGDPATYGQIIHRVDMPGMGDEIHHYGFNVFQTRMLVPGLFSGRMHLLDIEADPARPSLVAYHDSVTPDSGYIVPHTVIGMPDGGYLVSMIGSSSEDSGPGGVIRLDASARFVGPFGPGVPRQDQDTSPRYMYDIGINLLRNRMISTAFGLPAGVAGGINPGALGDEVYVWDFKQRKVLQVEKLGPSTGALEVRWLHELGSTIGFTNTPGTSEIWRWHDLDLDGHYEFDVAITLPPGSVPTDILISSDDKYLYVSNWVGSNVMQFDITDPFAPVLVSQVTIPDSQMMRLSPDNRRLYVTNSLLSTWDDDEFPAGVTRNNQYGVFLVVIDHDNGGMSIDPDFHVDLMQVQKQNTVGPARPHQVFFDPGVPRGFGEH
jgi:methanethiol oxidase